MRKTIAIVLVLLALTVIISGCLGKNTPSENQVAQPPQLPEGDANSGSAAPISGDIPAVDSGVKVEDPISTSGENVDLGSLI